jgi:hypothetical protein
MIISKPKSDLFENGISPPALESMAISQNTTDWINLNLSIAQLRSLPQTDKKLAFHLKTNEETVRTKFYELRDLNINIVKDATFWDQDLFPKTRNLATAIAEQAAFMITRIQNCKRSIGTTNPNDINELKKLFATDFVKSYTYAQQAKKDAESLSIDLGNFQTLFKGHKATLKGLKDSYKSEYNLDLENNKKLETLIQNLTTSISDLRSEYDRDVVIAATSVTYAWFTIFGFIAAAVVAGVYGSRATAALKQIQEDQNKIAEFQAEINAVNTLIATFSLANSFIDKVDKDINSVIGILDNVINDWDKMVSSLSVFVKEGDQQSVMLEGVFVIAKLRYESLETSWENIQTTAENYGRNCVKSVTGSAPPETKEEVDKAAVLHLERAYLLM